MKTKETDTKIKDLCENWEQQGSLADFDSEKVWGAIANQREKRRVFIPWYFSAVAAAVLLCFSVGLAYVMTQNNRLQEQYCGSLAQLHELQAQKPKVVVKKEVQIEYKTQLKEVVKESPKLQQEVQRLRLQLADIQQEKAVLQKQLSQVNTQMKVLADSVKTLKAREVTPFFAENTKMPCEQEVALADIKVNINEKALADLPNSIPQESEERGIKIVFREKKGKEVTKERRPFSSIPIN